jgi:hypothetical protein
MLLVSLLIGTTINGSATTFRVGLQYFEPFIGHAPILCSLNMLDLVRDRLKPRTRRACLAGDLERTEEFVQRPKYHAVSWTFESLSFREPCV